ncbi:spore coat protein CotJB [Bariatricus massiliensis]|uniref:Spore coat protein CotJB n=1 Tax=Bariatricus massiliensis TaxID=1745713 RepID=A0ABS8DM42_9FIRM|nr:spore coat protein CotJB [Bariatricus massiliensis]MCB7305944.1 spore coat protein CotJB [Bariatricus massiliensis]MCB7376466.1 spore coat protein CotJB [Bariatricus massiliensis]MCB7389087.1 spore coat protein CotJB [Bariatricus massiliensis]MCB7413260.1 spore coat protein CotJB [Bariatricus massiliensis]MCQ5255157.1 spore coat protein CotJB [Bariatricus massiliensis]
MSEQQLAIASVPFQQWGEIYDDKEALHAGTIFKDLNKPFFAASGMLGEPAEREKSSVLTQEPAEQKEREDMMRKIAQTCFALDDLTLYLDTHETESKAKELYREKLQEAEALKKEFAEKFYPLGRPCILYSECPNEEHFCWQKGPMPWEGACV